VLDRVLAIYHIYSGSLSDAAMQEVEREMEPRLAAFHDAITQNEALFARIAQVYAQVYVQGDSSGLTAEQQRLVWVQYQNFARTGAQLDAPSKARLSAINQTLAGLFTDFSQRILQDESDTYVVLHEASDLAGLPESEIAAAAAQARERSLENMWVIANTRSSVEPFLTYSTP
jgi:peptidyl-dipeptidase Dcp